MKKFFAIVSVLFVFSLLTACDVAVNWDKKESVVTPEVTKDEVKPDEKVEDNTKNSDVKDEEIKKLEEKLSDLEKKLEEKSVEEEKVVEKEEKEKKDEEVVKTYKYTGDNYITLNSPANESTILEEPIVFKGVVSPNTKKIVVKASGGVYGGGVDNPGFPYYEDVYTLKNFNYGDSSFVYRAKVEWLNLTYGSNDYEFTAYFDDGSTKSTRVSIYYHMAGGEMAKPVIYLYPEKPMNVFVDVAPTAGISVSDPEIGNGWNVYESPNGTLYNLADKEFYPYLFWEGFSYEFVTPDDGFVVESKNVSRFFDEKLSILGLKHKEIADFKEYWVPKLKDDPYYFITFIPQETFETYAPLTVYPEPYSVIRVFFDYKGLDEKTVVAPQNLVSPVREGFSVVEWGGRLYR